jgi:hypothetical protein
MHRVQTAAATISIALVTACATAPTPAAPSTAASTISVAAFGVLQPSTPADLGIDTFARCLAASGDGACFNAASIVSPPRGSGFPTTTTALANRRPLAADLPNPPAELTSSVLGPNVTLYWRAPATGPTPTNYLVEAGSAPGLTNLASFVTGTTYLSYSTVVTTGGIFYVRVRAVTAAGASLPSNETIVTTPDPALPGPPFLVRARSIGSSITLTWGPPLYGPAPLTYVIQASDRPGGPPTLANMATGNVSTAFFANGVPPGTYYVRVLAATSYGVGPASTDVALTVLPDPAACTASPSPPTRLVPGIAGSVVMLGWTISDGDVTTYVVEVGSVAGGTDLGSYETGSRWGNATFSGVPPGTYYVRVLARNACGTSGGSNETIVRVR